MLVLRLRAIARLAKLTSGLRSAIAFTVVSCSGNRRQPSTESFGNIGWVLFSNHFGVPSKPFCDVVGPTLKI